MASSAPKRFDSGKESRTSASQRSSGLSSRAVYGVRGYVERARPLPSATASSSSFVSSGYASKSGRNDVPLPVIRSQSFGRDEALSGVTVLAGAHKASTSSSLSRSSSIPVRPVDYRSYRSSGLRESERETPLSENSLRISSRRRQTGEESGRSKVGSESLKECNANRVILQKRDSESGNYERDVSSRRNRRINPDSGLQAVASTHEPAVKEDTSEVKQSPFRLSTRRWQSESVPQADMSCNTAADTAKSSFEQRDSSTWRKKVGDDLLQECGGSAGEEGRESSTSNALTCRLDPGVDDDEIRREIRAEETRIEDAVHSQESCHLKGKEPYSGRWRTQSARHPSPTQAEENDSSARQKSPEQETDVRGKKKNSSLDSKYSSDRTADKTRALDVPGVSDEQSRAERIARYKEERRKQLAHIATLTSTSFPRELEKTEANKDEAIFEVSDLTEGRQSITEQLDHRDTRKTYDDTETQDGDTRGCRHGNNNNKQRSQPLSKDVAGSGSKVDTTPNEEHSTQSIILSSIRKTDKTAVLTSTRSTSEVAEVSSAHPRSPGFRKTGLGCKFSEEGAFPSFFSLAGAGKNITDSKSDRNTKKSKFSSLKTDEQNLSPSAKTEIYRSPSPDRSRLRTPVRLSPGKEAVLSTGLSLSSKSSMSPCRSPVPSDEDAGTSVITQVTDGGTHVSTSGIEMGSGVLSPPKTKEALLPDSEKVHSRLPQIMTRTLSADNQMRTDKLLGDMSQVKSPNNHTNSSIGSLRDGGRKEYVPQTVTSVSKRFSSPSSAARSSHSPDAELGLGLSFVSSSSFLASPSVSSPEQEVGFSPRLTSSRITRLQRMPNVDISSSSSSREGSQEKQIVMHGGLESRSTTGAHLTETAISYAQVPSSVMPSTSTHSVVTAGCPDISIANPVALNSGSLPSAKNPDAETSDKQKVQPSDGTEQKHYHDASQKDSTEQTRDSKYATGSKPKTHHTEHISTLCEQPSSSLTLPQPFADVAPESLLQILPESDKSGSYSTKVEGSDQTEQGKVKEEDTEESLLTKEASWEPTSVCDVPSPPCSVSYQSRPKDKSVLRKSSLNKAEDSSPKSLELRSRKSPDEVSAARSKFSGEPDCAKPKLSVTVDKSPRLPRGKDFSQLLEKFSQSDTSSSERSDTDSGPHRRNVSTRQRAKDSSSSSDDVLHDATRKTPERSQSLKLPNVTKTAKDDTMNRVERSASFKSDLIRERVTPAPSNAHSSELLSVLNSRQEEVDRQLRSDEKVEDKRGDRRCGRAEQFKESALEDVIADTEVAAALKARRQETDSSMEQNAYSQTDFTDKRMDRVHQYQRAQQLDTAADTRAPDKSSSSSAEAESSTSSSHSVIQRRDMEKVSDISSSFCPNTHSRESQSTDNNCSAQSESSLLSVSPKIASGIMQREDSLSERPLGVSVTSNDMQENSSNCNVIIEDSKQFRAVHSSVNTCKEEIDNMPCVKVSKESESAANTCFSIQSAAMSVATTVTTVETTPIAAATTVTAVSSTVKCTGSSPRPLTSSLHRSGSLKAPSASASSESPEPKKGILKRTSSLSKQDSDTSVDPQLLKIMQQRRLREQQVESNKQNEGDVPPAGFERQRALSAAEEIESNIRQMRDGQANKKTEQSAEEAELCVSVTERILKMESKLEEKRQPSVTPRGRSGAATPILTKSPSGTVTPRKECSVDKQTPSGGAAAAQGNISTPDLMAKLSNLASQSAVCEDRRHKFQRRPRDDWRVRTQPITLDEIQEADSLDSVSQFRALVRRNASKNIFEHLSCHVHNTPVPSRNTEFPQHLVPEKRKRRSRLQRCTTLPVTAKELNAIPEGEPLGQLQVVETADVYRRDSRADSGILSGSEMETSTSESLRGLSLEMDTSESDPSRMSVTSKTALFRSLDEKARAEREKEKSASGAKRYIDRKKRERSRTQPVTDDEVKTAAEFAEEEKKKLVPVHLKFPQPEVINRPISPSAEKHDSDEEDHLTKLSLVEKVKLFSTPKESLIDGTSSSARVDTTVPRRRQRKLTSRFNTQPVTSEEVEKASRISPLAMSLVKPPDPELLIGLRIKDQQELMMMHAETTLSQCSSRSGSRASSQPASRRGSFTTSDMLPVGAENASAVSPQQILMASNPLLETDASTVTAAIDPAAQPQAPIADLTLRAESEPRGILKKTKSTESFSEDSTFKAMCSDEMAEATTPEFYKEEGSTESSDKNKILQTSNPDCGGKVSTENAVTGGGPNPSKDIENSGSGKFYLCKDNPGDHSLPDMPVLPTADDKRRSRFADRKAQTERYLTQPAPEVTSDQSPQSRRKFRYEGRHMTQPITPDEMKEAESSASPYGLANLSGGSIAERLNQLKVSGEESWKKRTTTQKGSDSGLPAVNHEKGDKGRTAIRPSTIADRLSQLEESAETWRGRIEETDAKQFAVASKISKVGSAVESPLVAKLRASKKDLTKLDDTSNTGSPVSSPSTPTKEFLPRIPLPKDIIVDPHFARNSEQQDTHKEDSAVESRNQRVEPIHIEVPMVDDEEIKQFFATKEVTEIADKLDLNIDDFDNIFIESSEILQTVRKIRPSRRKKASGHNPLKTVAQFVEVQTAYMQITSVVAEKELRRLKTEDLAREAALAGLASIENFSKVELRKTESSVLPAALGARHNPFSDLMLLHVKGRRNVQTRLVAPVAKSINAGDCFILVTPDKVIYWIGEYSNIIEKAKAAEIATFIQQKRDLCFRGTTSVASVDQVKDHLGAGKNFWASLEGDKEIQGCGPDEEDELYESSIVKTNMIYHLVDNALEPYHQYWGSTLRHEMLQEKEVIIFDFGSEFYVWQGKAVDMQQRKQGMALAKQLWEKGYDYSECAVNPICPLYLEELGGVPSKSSHRPDWAVFGKINQHMETILFREKFADWPDSSRLIGVKTAKTLEMKSEFADIKAYDAVKMIPTPNTPVTMVLDGAHVGRGKKWQEDMQGFIKEQDIITLGVRVWHIQEYDHCCLPEASYGQFHRGDTYVVRWQYMITNAGLRSLKGHGARHSLTGRERCAYFFWQGQESSINEKGASALMTVELDEERGPQVRVVQGKEPPCFLNLFEGRMIIHLGKREDPATNTQGPWRMYHVRGDASGEMCLLEIPVSIVNLRSRTSLILLNVETGIAYIWHGCKSPKHVRAMAVQTVQNIKEKQPLELGLHPDASVTAREVEEGEEISEMWVALGEKNRALYHCMLSDVAVWGVTPRLFYMSSVSMVFEVTELLNPARLPGTNTSFPFFQSDLYKASQPALFLLDVGHAVYLWQGWWPVGSDEVRNIHTGSARARYNHDRRCAMETTLHYCKERKQGSCPTAYLIYAGAEPLDFRNLFPYWECDSTVQELAVKEGRTDGYHELVENFYAKFVQAQYTLLQLQDRPLPDGVDPLRLETYLSDEEFEEVFDMKKEDFYKLPTWKQNQLKQSLGLY